MWFLIVITLINSPLQAGTQVTLTQPTISSQAFADEPSCKTVRDAINLGTGQTSACVPATVFVP